MVRSLIERSQGTDVEIVPLGRPELDLAGPAEAVIAAMEAANPDMIVSAAAYTQVDRAEGEPELAFAINEGGARALAQAASRIGVPLVHLSTDYVFDGSKTSPYVERDSPEPTGVYGASKLAGERAVLSEQPNSVVLRTAWVYSPFGSNFVKTMLRLASERAEIAVVDDQRGSPTSALDIADGVLRVATNLCQSDEGTLRGLFHMGGVGDASWAEFAETVFSVSQAAGGPAASVRPIGTADYPTAAKRPANSRLNSDKLARIHGVRLPQWQSSLKDVVDRLVQAERLRS